MSRMTEDTKTGGAELERQEKNLVLGIINFASFKRKTEFAIVGEFAKSE